MGWIDEQLKYREQSDIQMFESSLEDIAYAVMGQYVRASIDKKIIAGSAIEEVLKFYNIKSQVEDIPSQIESFDEQLEYRLRPHGILSREVELDEGWYRDAIGPMLGTLKESGIVVALIPSSLGGYSYYDYTKGIRVRINRRTQKLVDVDAICFYKPLPNKKLSMWDLLKYSLEQLSVVDIVMYLGIMALAAVVGLLLPYFMKWMYGSVLKSGSVKVLMALAFFMLSYTISRFFISVFTGLVNTRISMKQSIVVEAAVMNRMLSLNTRFFKEYSPGELSQRADYINVLCDTLVNTIGELGIPSIFSLIYIGQIFGFAEALVTPALTVTIITVIVTLITTFMQMGISKKGMELSTKTGGLTYSMISGIQKIKLAGAEKRMFARWAKQYAKEAKLLYNPPMFLKFNGAITMTISLMGNLVMYYIAYISHVSVADYTAFNAAYGMISAAFMSLASVATTIATIRPILQMVKPILEAETELDGEKEIVTSIRGAIEFSNVSFKYSEDQPNVIDDLSLRIKAGEYVAIVGPTGCGKSTLIRLLLGFETPQKGSIYFDRKDMKRLDLKSLRSKIGTVTQDGKLFMGDIYSNIVISAPHLTQDDAWEAAKIASIDEDIRKMPMGMNTLICEGQGGISGGQKQRLMIARAVAHKPKLLIFDEATSALDNITQKKVSEAIDNLKCTRIVVAHRLSTIRHCDRIIVFNGGKIVEQGTYEKLIESKGFFAELVERQRIDI